MFNEYFGILGTQLIAKALFNFKVRFLSILKGIPFGTDDIVSVSYRDVTSHFRIQWLTAASMSNLHEPLVTGTALLATQPGPLTCVSALLASAGPFTWGVSWLWAGGGWPQLAVRRCLIVGVLVLTEGTCFPPSQLSSKSVLWGPHKEPKSLSASQVLPSVLPASFSALHSLTQHSYGI